MERRRWQINTVLQEYAAPGKCAVRSTYLKYDMMSEWNLNMASARKYLKSRNPTTL